MGRSEHIRSSLDSLLKLRLQRILLFGAGMFMLLSLMDYFAAQEYFSTFLRYRVVASLALIGGSFAVGHIDRVDLLYMTGLLAVAVSAIAIELMVLNFGGHQSTYYVGMILLAICAVVFIPAPAYFHFTSLLMIYAIYAVPILATEQIVDIQKFFVANSFISTCFAAIFLASYFTRNLLENDFGLQYDLDRERDRTERRFVTFMKHLPGLAYVKDGEGRYVYTNENHKNVFGQWEGKTDAEIHGPEKAGKLAEADARVLSLGETQETVTKTGHNEEVHYWMDYKFPLTDERGKPTHVAGISVDITDRRKFYDERLKAQKLEALGELSSGMSHDFNNILSIILNNLVLVRMQGLESVAEYVEKSIDAVKRGKDMVGNLLDFSRGASIEPEAVSLGAITMETINFMGKSSDMHVRTSVEVMPGLWDVHANPSQLQQLVMNLYQNAKEALQGYEVEEGRDLPSISFKLDNVVIPADSLAGRFRGSKGEFVRLMVKDNGCGMDEASKSHIFEPFYSTKGAGRRGIGLSAAYGIVKHSHGWIDVESELGSGTVFSVYIPRYEGEGTRKPIEQEKIAHGSELVLLVDDERQLADSAAEILEQLGYKVLVSYSGEEALRLFRENRDSIDLVIMDMVMPGLSGVELLPMIKQINPDARVLIASGNVNQGQLRPREGDFNFYLPKPYSLEAMSAKVREALGKPGAQENLKQYINKVKLFSVREKTIPYAENVTSSLTVYKLFRHIAFEPREKFVVLFLDSQRKIIAYDEVTQGTFNEAVVHPQEVIRTALLTNASSIILVHNHPAGDLEPSAHDLELTSAIVEACKMFNIEFLDHLIMGRDRYFSFSADDSADNKLTIGE